MTHPMIEKCARVLRPGIWETEPDPECELHCVGLRDDACADVIAVLRTLREPDEGMIDAGCSAWMASTGFEDANEPLASFTAMIDSLLPEEKEQP